MRAATVDRGRRLVASALARAESFLLEPVEAVSRPAEIRIRPVVAVVGLSAGCGATTVARALAVALALRDPTRAAAVAGDGRLGGLPLANSSAGRLGRAIGTGGGLRLRPMGRLCLIEGGEPAPLADAVRHLAPLVLDVSAERAGVAASLADHVVLVSSPAVEPALAAVVAGSLARVGPTPLVVLNRVDGRGAPEAERWSEVAAISIRESPAGARLALAGRSPRGALASGLAELADACAAVGSAW